MKTIQISIGYTYYDSIDELSQEDRVLVQKAEEALKTSYSPYSEFSVGAAILVEGGDIVAGSNQENSVSPACMCAERIALFSAKVQYPDRKILAVAITAKTAKFEIEEPVSPCGGCRQAYIEAETRQQAPIRVILHSPVGKVVVFDSFASLLPFTFNETRLQNY
ncbi:MAG: cytidine deaminase [Bacteroidales bacterium]|nr:cytidine deaminase [Bacteroidales bacterium]